MSTSARSADIAACWGEKAAWQSSFDSWLEELNPRMRGNGQLLLALFADVRDSSTEALQVEIGTPPPAKFIGFTTYSYVIHPVFIPRSVNSMGHGEIVREFKADQTARAHD